MNTMRKLWLAFLVGGLIACSPDPKDCTDKGDDSACHKLCETGKAELQHLCYTPRARAVVACVDKGTGCDEACKNWQTATLDETIRGYYLANIGDTAKVAAADAKCGKAP
jgi:hypothetical protein